MKPINLIMNSFGAYAKKAEIPFAKLGEKGLFLITGDTGSGKTTIFDAISFALYGEASGCERSVETLQSDFSQKGDEPYVELEFSHRGQVYKIKRNLAYMRRSKKGEGFVEEKANAEMHFPNGEVIAGSTVVTQRVTEILCIDRRQWSQIAMIAQGEFRKLLFADSKERAQIFRRVFSTEIYLRVQNSLKDISTQAYKEHEEKKAFLLGKIKEISRSDGDELAKKLVEIKERNNIFEMEYVDKLLNEILLADEGKYSEACENSEKISERLAELTAVVARAQQDNLVIEELKKEEKLLEELEKRKSELEKDEIFLHRAQIANTKILPKYREYQSRKDEVLQLGSIASQLKAEIEKTEPQLERLKTSLDKFKENQPYKEHMRLDIGTIESSFSDYEEMERLAKEIKNLREQEKTAGEELKALIQHKESCIAAIEKLQKRLEVTEGCEASLEKCTASLENAVLYKKYCEQAISIYKELGQKKEELVVMQNDYLKAQGEYDSVRKVWEEKEREFLLEQAGILAQKLSDGEACPVCGSKNHPKKAELSENAPTETEIKQLKSEVEEMQKSAQEKSGKCAEKSAQIKAEQIHFEKLLEYHIPKCRQDFSLLEVEVAEAEKLVSDTETKKEILQKYVKEKIFCTQKIKDGNDAVNVATEKFEEAREKVSLLQNRLAIYIGEENNLKKSLKYASKKEAEESLTALKEKLDDFTKKEAECEREYSSLYEKQTNAKAVIIEKSRWLEKAEKSLEEAENQFSLALNENGFENKEDYIQMLITDEEISKLSGKIELEKQNYKITVERINYLKKQADGKEYIDISEKQDLLQKLTDERKSAERQLREMWSVINKNKEIKQILRDGEAKRLVLEKDYSIKKELSDTANGNLSGKMKLDFEKFVQAAYFTKIIAEANKRLGVMTSGRYILAKRDDASNLRSQMGLELEVVDNYTGKPRDIKSLSGGEAFMASLSMALGLSDVIQNNAGGVEVDTMFIDEGFGSLDEGSLEQAINTLAQLTGTNRLVGIISHVAGLQERIDRKIVVKKSIMGSTVSIKNE